MCYIGAMDRDSFATNGLTRDAVERCVERVCEAVHRLSDQAETLMPGHPWAAIRGTANRLRHANDRIDTDVIWVAACTDVPALAADARSALERLQAGTPDAG